MNGLKIYILKNLKEKYGDDDIPYTKLKHHIMRVFRVPKIFIDNLISDLISADNLNKNGAIITINYTEGQLQSMIDASNLERNRTLTE